MSGAELTSWISFAEYLEEEDAEERHEYIDGKVFQMAGASERHEIVAGKSIRSDPSAS